MFEDRHEKMRQRAEADTGFPSEYIECTQLPEELAGDLMTLANNLEIRIPPVGDALSPNEFVPLIDKSTYRVRLLMLYYPSANTHLGRRGSELWLAAMDLQAEEMRVGTGYRSLYKFTPSLTCSDDTAHLEAAIDPHGDYVFRGVLPGLVYHLHLVPNLRKGGLWDSRKDNH